MARAMQITKTIYAYTIEIEHDTSMYCLKDAAIEDVFD